MLFLAYVLLFFVAHIVVLGVPLVTSVGEPLPVSEQELFQFLQSLLRLSGFGGGMPQRRSHLHRVEHLGDESGYSENDEGITRKQHFLRELAV